MKRADQISAIYAEAAADLSAWLRDGTDFQRGRAAHLLSQVDRITARAGIQAGKIIDQSIEPQYRAALAETDKTLRRIGVPNDELPTKGHFDRINERAVETLVRDTKRDVLSAGAQLAERTKRAIRQTAQICVADSAVSAAVAKGLIAGGSVRSVTTSLQKMFAEGEARRLVATGKFSPALAEELTRVNDGFLQVGKMQLRIKDYAATVAVTRLAEAQSIATEDRVQQAGFDLIIITGPSTGDFCDEFVGKVYSISGDHPDYPPISELPGQGTPFHPHCVHVEAPFIPKFATDKELARASAPTRFLGLSGSEAQQAYRALAAKGAHPRPREVKGMKAAGE